MAARQIRFFLSLMLLLAAGGLLGGCQTTGAGGAQPASQPAYVQPY